VQHTSDDTIWGFYAISLNIFSFFKSWLKFFLVFHKSAYVSKVAAALVVAAAS